jgi:acetyl-CoA C-acetyltransferase
VERAGLGAADIDEVIMGNVLMAGQGQAPARQAALGAGLDKAVPCTTINKMCGSGLKAAMFAYDQIRAGTNTVMIAGGMESMTNAPYLLAKARGGYRYGHGELLDHMALDGLEDAYEKRTAMGVYAERTAEKYGFTRQQQDEFAIASLTRAQKATADGSFAFEIAPVEVPGKGGVEKVGADEQPGKAKPEKIPTLKPAFKKDGTITAANASSISDGAAALVLMTGSEAQRRGIKPLARVLGHSQHSRTPAEFTVAPVYAIGKLLEKLSWTAANVDLWEINEAFAVVTMAAMKEHKLPHDKVNIHGGACALGHPIGASGARLVTTLVGALRKTGGKRGIASLCIGGGEAVALAIEMI